MTPEEFGKRTDRELWEWYVKPAIERSKRWEAEREGKGGTAFEPKTEEEILLALSMLGLAPPPNGAK